MPSQSPFQITLFGNDPGDQQWSILDYGLQLHHHLSVLLQGRGNITLSAPSTPPQWRRWRLCRAAAMYGSRYLRYPRLVKRASGDLFHFLDYGNCWVARFLDPARTVITSHDLIPLIFRQQGSLWPWVSEQAYRHSLCGLQRAAKVLAVSTCTRNDLVRLLKIPEERIHVIPLGLDPQLRPPASSEEKRGIRSALPLPNGVLLLHVGQNAFYKNIEGVLQCLRILLDRKEPAWLIRAGDWLRKGQRRLARSLNVLDRVVELGPLPREKLRRIYQAADLLIHPSWYEGLGLPPLEAMASGLPVIVSNRGALPETVAEAGLVVDPEDPARLADAAQRLLREPTLRTCLQEQGLSRAAQFRWEKTARLTLTVYEQLLHAH